MIETRPDSPLADVGSFIRFAIRWRDLVWRTFKRYPPDSVQRWRIHRVVCPRYTDDVAETRLVRALAAAERVGQGEAWRQLLGDLDFGLKDYARRFVDSAELPCEPSALNTTLNELLPAVEAVRQAMAAARLEGGGGKPTKTPPVIEVSPDGSTVTIDGGEPLRLKGADDGVFIRALLAKRGQVVKGRTLETNVGRPDRIYRRLPKAVRQLISPPGRGQTGYLLS